MNRHELANELAQLAEALRRPDKLELGCDSLMDAVKSLKVLENDMSLTIQINWYEHHDDPQILFQLWDGHKHTDAKTIDGLVEKVKLKNAPVEETSLAELSQILTPSPL